MLYAILLLAQEAAQQQQQNPEKPWWTMLVWILPILVLFWLLLLRPAQTQEKQRQSMIANMKKNDEVLTIAGLYGSVVSVSDTKDEVVLKIDDNTRIRVTKASIARNVTQEEAAREAAAQAKATK
jgi:preprotein translocase subunit YajC